MVMSKSENTGNKGPRDDPHDEFDANLQMAGMAGGKNPVEKNLVLQAMEDILKKIGSPDPARSAAFILEIAEIAPPQDLPNIIQKELRDTIKNPAVAAEIPRLAANLSRIAITGSINMPEARPPAAAPAQASQQRPSTPPLRLL